MALGLENRIPPPIVALCTAGLMYAAAWVVPVLGFGLPWRRTIAIGVAVLGGSLDVAAVLQFLRVKTTVNPLDPTAAAKLVTSGLFKLTRNPMYLGLALLLLAWGIYLANVVALALMPLFVLYINRFQIAPEERALRARFGSDFDAYCRRVGRWF